VATRERTASFIAEQLAGLSGIVVGKMFGEYGVWCNGKIVALICDDQLFVKPTASGRNLACSAPEAPPYPGAKPNLLIEQGLWEDAAWLTNLIRVTAEELPMSKEKQKKAGK
jgi:TfoX/Sxy family transcriptional regulator of competence genes